ncbi:hypothetical protein [Flavobacterium sp.]|jgi:hypothetical protein|uniref:hypothetical protein n=1 Tax=Flavobacterium sp. TaxID=239 RepID=UPI0037BFBC76
MWVADHSPTHRTTKLMLFDDPFQQVTLEIPAQTPCLLVRSVEIARLYGLLQDPIEIQLSKAALAKGLRLVWLHGRLRHLEQNEIERLSPDNQPFFTRLADNHQPEP